MSGTKEKERFECASMIYKPSMFPPSPRLDVLINGNNMPLLKFNAVLNTSRERPTWVDSTWVESLSRWVEESVNTNVTWLVLKTNQGI